MASLLAFSGRFSGPASSRPERISDRQNPRAAATKAGALSIVRRAEIIKGWSKMSNVYLLVIGCGVLALLYGAYAIRGRLTHLEMLPASACP